MENKNSYYIFTTKIILGSKHPPVEQVHQIFPHSEEVKPSEQHFNMQYLSTQNSQTLP